MAGKAFQDDGKALRRQVEAERGVGFSSNQTWNTRPADWVHLKGILALKSQEENVESIKKKNYNLFSTCTWMHAISNSRCDVLFYVEGKGLIWSFWLCRCSSGEEEQSFKLTEISCKAEMLCLERVEAELRSASKRWGGLFSCVTVLAALHSCVKTSAPSLVIGTILETNWKKQESIERNTVELWRKICRFFSWTSFGGVLNAPCPLPFHCDTDIKSCKHHNVRAGKTQWKG